MFIDSKTMIVLQEYNDMIENTYTDAEYEELMNMYLLEGEEVNDR